MLGVETPTSEPGDASSPLPGSTDFSEGPGDRIGHYKLLEVIGEGAFGVVWMAEQETPVRRRVALKVIKPGVDTRAVVARFEAERQALALMDHPSIARVFDGGATQSGRPYFVMELVRGVPLTQFCDLRQLNTHERLSLFFHVCQAVQHAHQKGIIHRDLKPSNILITEQDGRAVPKVIDFGIAKATEQHLTDKTLFTHFNQFIGTPAYMSPEQTGLGLDIDTRSDVYSLGVLLYELITGRLPFDIPKLLEAGIDVARKAIRETEPLKPSTRLSTLARDELLSVAARRKEAPDTLNKMVRGELDWIILKALEKDRARRYATANGLAADVERFLKNEPVTAAPPDFRYRFAKFARRHRTALVTATAFLFVLLAGVVITTWLAVRAERLAAAAQRNLAQARLNAYASEMNLAQQALAENNLERAVQLLDLQLPKPGDNDDLRGFEWRYLWQLCQGNEKAVLRDASFGSFIDLALALSPDSQFIAYNTTNQVVVRDAKTHRLVTHLPATAHHLAFSPDSRMLAVAHLEIAPVRLWDTANWTELHVPQLADSIAPVVFSPDGEWLVAATSGTNLLQLHATKNWNVVASCPHTPLLSVSLRSAVAFSPDGKLLLTPWMEVLRRGKAGMFLWKVPTLEKHSELFRPGIPLQSAGFLPDGRHLVTAGWLGDLLVWDIQANPPAIIQQEREHTAYIPALAVASKGQFYATGSADQSICLWDAWTHKRIARWRGHRREVWGLAITPDGQTLASASPDGTVRFWSGQPQNGGELLDDAGDIAGFSSDGTTLVLGPSEDDYRWQLITGTNRIAIPIPPDPPLKFDFIRPYSVTGNQPLAALGRRRGRVELWDLGVRRLAGSWNPDTNGISSVAFSPDGSRLAAGDEGGIVRIWEITTHRQIAELRVLNGFVTSLAFSPDGNLLATGTQGSRQTRIWNLATFKPIIPIGADANKIAFSPDGKFLVTCTVMGNEARIWELPSGREKTALKGHVGGLTEVTFSPDGRTMATGAYDGRIKLWNTAVEQEVATLPYPGMLTALQFSPDGRTLAGSVWTSPGYRAVLFRAPLLEEIASAENRARRSAQK